MYIYIYLSVTPRAGGGCSDWIYCIALFCSQEKGEKMHFFSLGAAENLVVFSFSTVVDWSIYYSCSKWLLIGLKQKYLRIRAISTYLLCYNFFLSKQICRLRKSKQKITTSLYHKTKNMGYVCDKQNLLEKRLESLFFVVHHTSAALQGTPSPKNTFYKPNSCVAWTTHVRQMQLKKVGNPGQLLASVARVWAISG